MTVKIEILPRGIHGCICRSVEPDGDYEIIVLNALDPPSVQQQAFEHEMEHWRRGHLDDPRPLWIREQEADYGSIR